MKWTIEAGDADLISAALLAYDEPASTPTEIIDVLRKTANPVIIARLIVLARQVDAEAEGHAQQRAADHVDGYDRDDLGESPDY